MTSPLDLSALKALEEKATAEFTDQLEHWANIVKEYDGRDLIAADIRKAAAFIAASRTALPALIKRVEELERDCGIDDTIAALNAALVRAYQAEAKLATVERETVEKAMAGPYEVAEANGALGYQWRIPGGDGNIAVFVSEHDAKFFAAARTALPALIARVAELDRNDTTMRNTVNLHATVIKQKTAEIAALQSRLATVERETVEKCWQAVWDASGDNAEFHCAAIRALAPPVTTKESGG